MSALPLSLWKQVYEQASVLYALAPWNWMLNVDLFGVKDPETGDIGYCGIWGAGGRTKGFAMFRGSSGLLSFERMLEQDPEQTRLIDTFQLDGMVLTFVPKSELDPVDLALLAQTGWEESADGNWPLLRDHSPGLLPWQVEQAGDLARFSTSLEQAILLSRRFRQDPDLLDDTGTTHGRLLVRTPHSFAGQLRWVDEWLPEPSYFADLPSLEYNRLYLLSNCSGQDRKKEDWVTDVFFFPSPIRKKQERPFLPQVVLLADVNKGKLLGRGRFQREELASGIEQLFVDTMKKAGGLPRSIITTRPETYAIWEPLAHILSLELQLRSDEPLIDEIKSGLFDSLSI